MKTTLLIDDWRNYIGDDIETVRTYLTGIEALKKQRWDTLYLDHDLGEEKTGYDILCWLEKNPQYLPKEIILVTNNPIGRLRMQLVITKLYNKE